MTKAFKPSNDQPFVEKVREVVGLRLDPPDRFHKRFTPTSAPWLDHVERFFGLIAGTASAAAPSEASPRSKAASKITTPIPNPSPGGPSRHILEKAARGRQTSEPARSRRMTIDVAGARAMAVRPVEFVWYPGPNSGALAMIDLHYWPTPNGKKVTILLEELGTPYNIVPCNIGKGDQFKPEFLKISPNNRMPALVDHAPADGGPPIAIFESGAILMYLAEKAGRFYPQDLRRRFEVTQWVIWQTANQGPKLGECGHFRRLGDKQGDQSYAVRRFTDEANRLYGVLNNRLYDRRYLAGDEYTIADMISYPWTVNWKGQGQDIEEFKYFKRWFDELSARPAVQRGLAVMAGPSEDPESLPAEERERRTKLLYNQRARPAPAEGGLSAI